MSDYSEAFTELKNAFSNARDNAIIYGNLTIDRSNPPPESGSELSFFGNKAPTKIPSSGGAESFPSGGESSGGLVGTELIGVPPDPPSDANELLTERSDEATEALIAERIATEFATAKEGIDLLTADYFPALSNGFAELPESVLIDLLGDTANFDLEAFIPQVGDVWDKAFIELERSSDIERETTTALFSSSGFSLPPGALAQSMREIEKTRTQELNKAVRDQAITNAQLAGTIYQTALTTAASMKTAMIGNILNALNTFYVQIRDIRDLGFKHRELEFRARQEVENLTRDFFNLELAYGNFLIEFERTRTEVFSQDFKNAIESYRAGNADNALSDLAQEYVQMASAIATSQGTIAQSFA